MRNEREGGVGAIWKRISGAQHVYVQAACDLQDAGLCEQWSMRERSFTRMF